MDILPWYRQFWPWFIIALPAVVIVACLYTVYLAFRSADTLIEDDYYRQGLAINESIASEQLAVELGIEGLLQVYTEGDQIELRVELYGAELEYLLVSLRHPFDEMQDQEIRLEFSSKDSLFKGRSRFDLQRWYIELKGQAADGKVQDWRIQLEHDFSLSRQLPFG